MRNEKGFSLMQIVVSVIIVLILGTIIGLAYFAMIGQSKVASYKTSASSISDALAVADVDHELREVQWDEISDDVKEVMEYHQEKGTKLDRVVFQDKVVEDDGNEHVGHLEKPEGETGEGDLGSVPVYEIPEETIKENMQNGGNGSSWYIIIEDKVAIGSPNDSGSLGGNGNGGVCLTNLQPGYDISKGNVMLTRQVFYTKAVSSQNGFVVYGDKEPGDAYDIGSYKDRYGFLDRYNERMELVDTKSLGEGFEIWALWDVGNGELLARVEDQGMSKMVKFNELLEIEREVMIEDIVDVHDVRVDGNGYWLVGESKADLTGIDPHTSNQASTGKELTVMKVTEDLEWDKVRKFDYIQGDTIEATRIKIVENSGDGFDVAYEEWNGSDGTRVVKRLDEFGDEEREFVLDTGDASEGSSLVADSEGNRYGLSSEGLGGDKLVKYDQDYQEVDRVELSSPGNTIYKEDYGLLLVNGNGDVTKVDLDLNIMDSNSVPAMSVIPPWILPLGEGVVSVTPKGLSASQKSTLVYYEDIGDMSTPSQEGRVNHPFITKIPMEYEGMGGSEGPGGGSGMFGITGEYPLNVENGKVDERLEGMYLVEVTSGGMPVDMTGMSGMYKVENRQLTVFDMNTLSMEEQWEVQNSMVPFQEVSETEMIVHSTSTNGLSEVFVSEEGSEETGIELTSCLEGAYLMDLDDEGLYQINSSGALDTVVTGSPYDVEYPLPHEIGFDLTKDVMLYKIDGVIVKERPFDGGGSQSMS